LKSLECLVGTDIDTIIEALIWGGHIRFAATGTMHSPLG